MPAKNLHLTMRRRVAMLFLGVSAALFFLCFRLGYVQVWRCDYYRARALEQRLRPMKVDAQRGAIYDRKGEELAVSINADAVYAVPVEVKNPRETAAKLAPILGVSPEKLYQKLTRRSAGEWLGRKLTLEQAQKVRALRLPGIALVPRPQRFYPNGTLAAHLLGIAGIDNQGLEGLEIRYDRYLRGVPGRIVAERDARNREIPAGINRYIPPQPGDSLVLTIDKVIQHIAERELDRAVAETGSRQGLVIIMDPHTGEILALAVRPTFDPNHFEDFPAANRRNIAITDLYEPGSTFKVITAATALETGVAKPETEFVDPGFIVVTGHRLRCWKAGGHGHQTFVEAVENSCNPVFAKLALELGPERFHEYIRAFGFGSPTGIDFPGEAVGQVRSPSRKALGWQVGWANIGFGQGVSVTPLQLITAVAAIANGGKLMVPHLVREIRRADGKVLKRIPPQEVRQVISEETARTLSGILRSVVVNGSGGRADLPGYLIAGKTGTGQIAEGGRYSRDRVNSSFIGFGPVDNPRLIGLVVLKEPQTAITYGGTLAAPVFANIMKDVFAYLGVPPRKEKDDDSGPAGRGKETKGNMLVVVPNVRNYPLAEAQKQLLAAGLTVDLEGTGEVVVDQTPKPGAGVKPGTRVILYFRREELYNGKEDEVTVPDLQGLTVRDAAGTLSFMGLGLEIVGSGVATSQSPRPGTKVKPGAKVRVIFAPPAAPKPPPASGERKVSW